MITIVTDSSAYFKEAEARELGINVIPIRYMVNGRTYDELHSDRNGNFEYLLKHGIKPSTTQPDAATFFNCFQNETAKGNEVLCITISSKLSGTYSAAEAASKQMENVAVFDSRMTAGGLYLLVKRAHVLIHDGLSLSEIVNKLEEIRNKITVTFSVASIDPLRKSGRIGFVRMSVETILNIKPILFLKEGVVAFSGTARGNANIIKKMLHAVNSHAAEVVINYIGNGHLAVNLYNILEMNYSNLTVNLRKMGPVLGIHLGLDVVAVSVFYT